MSPDLSVRSAFSRATRQILPWVLALAVATCTDDSTGPSKGGVGYFSFRPVYTGVTSSLSQFGIVADSVHVLLTRPVDEVVLDTTVFFPPDSASISLALPVMLAVSPEVLSAMIEIKAGGTVLFVDTVEVEVVDGPPGSTPPATATLEYVGPGNDIASITVFPADTTIFFGDTLFYTSSALDSSSAPVTDYYVGWTTDDTSFAKVNGQGRLIAPATRGTVRIIGHTPTGIADTAQVTIAPVPGQITADSGAAQAGIVGDSLATEFVARVVGADLLPIEGIPVRFTATTAGGAVRDSVLFTDANGRVRTRGVFGTAAGGYTWTATVIGTALSADFTATAGAGPAASIAVQGGDAQTDTAGFALPLPLTARVADAFDNPVAGAKVYWTRITGTGTVGADSSFTDAAGLAAVGYTLGAVGVDSIRADLAGTSGSAWFTATAISGLPAAIAIQQGDAQADTVGRLLADSLAVMVTSATALPVVGTPVVWTVLRGGVVTSDTTLSDSAGRAAVGYTLGTVSGIDSVRAQAGGVSVVFTASVTNDLPGLLTLVSGDGQTDTTGVTLAPFVVRVTDAYGNYAPEGEVTFEVLAGAGDVFPDTVYADGAGLAQASLTLGALAGTNSVRASLTNTSAFVDFTATAVTPAVASILTLGGDGQTLVVGQVSTDTLVVSVRDGSNNPIPGVDVLWSVIPAVGDLEVLGQTGILRNVSDSLGIARAVFTAGTQVGQVRIEVEAGDITDSLFVDQVADTAAAIVIVSGDGQSDTAGSAIPLPFVARVNDAFGNAVSGATVAFTRVAGSGTLFADSLLTDVNGEAAVGYLFGPVPGVDTIRATLASTGAFVDFTATTIAGTPASITFLTGFGQVDTVAQPLAESLLVAVQDADSRPLGGIQIVWSARQGATASADTTVTDELGHTWVHFTLGTVAGEDTLEARTLDGTVSNYLTALALPEAPTAIAIVAGDGASDTVSSATPTDLTARVADTYGNVVPSTPVAFAVTSGGGSVSPDTAYSDVAGEATVGYLAGALPGSATIRATLAATGAFVDFDVTLLARAPATLSLIAGTTQSDTVTQTLTDSLTVQVLDIDGFPVTGHPVEWLSTLGGTFSADTTYTDAAGLASVQYTFGTVAGVDTLTVRTLDGSYSTFTVAMASPAVASAIALESGDAQVDTAGRVLTSPVTAKVTDAYGNPVMFAQVALAITAGGGSYATSDTVLTDSDGNASTIWQLGAAPGANGLRMTLAGTSAFVDFTATGVNPEVQQVQAHAGYGQVDTVGLTLPDSLKVRVLDGLSAPIVNAAIEWTVVRGGAVAAETTYTDIDGYSATAYTLGTAAGEDSVEARVIGSAPVALFTAQALAGSGAAIAIMSGNAQVDTIGITLPAPLVALVTDVYGNPSPFQTVVFTVEQGTGSLSQDTVQSDVNGHASVQYTLGALPAVDQIRASLAGTSAFVDFTATAVAGLPTQLLVYAGDGQTDTVLATVADSLVVELRDASNGPVPGVWLHWTPLYATLSADSTLTDVNGRAAVQATYTTFASSQVLIEVATPDTALVTTFTLHALPGAATTLDMGTGDGQVELVGATLPVPFTTFVTDAYANAVPNAPVAYTRTFGNGLVAPDTAYSDSVGVAQAAYTLGGVIGQDTIVAHLVGTAATQTFIATAIAGPPASLTYVSGTGQADTVARLLPAPLRVQVQDAGGNPRDNVWVRWTRTAATGVLSVDSTLTDATGAAEVGYTLGTVAGFDTVLATLEGLGDTVRFYAEAENDQPATFTLVSGDSQSTAVGNATASQVVFVLRDTYGNGVGGIGVSFAAAPGSSAPGSSEGTTAEDGTTSAGFWTVDTTAGFNTLTATAGALTATATATGLPIGTSRQWAGVASTDWSASANWLPAGAPLSTDTVFIPSGTPFAPALTAPSTVGKVIVQSGVTVDLGTQTLQATTGVEGSGATFTATTGTLTLFGGSWNSSATNLEAGNGTVLGTGTVSNDLTVLTGGFDLNGHTLAVSGDVTVGGPLVMATSSDSLDVGGTLVVGYTDMTGYTAAGTIVVHGDFQASSLFRPVGTNLVVFTGSAPQTASFSDPTSSWFHDLRVDNPAGLAMQSNVWVQGTVTQVNGHISGTNASVGGGIIAAQDTAWAFAMTHFLGTTIVAPDTLHGSAVFEGSAAAALAGPMTILGDLMLVGSDAVSIVNTPLRVTGVVLQATPSSGIVMGALADTLEVGGLLTVTAGNNDLTAGTLLLHGGLTQNPGSNFRPGPNLYTVFAGDSLQSVALFNSGTGPTNSYFGDVAIADSVIFTANATFTDTLTLQSGGTVTGGTLSLYGELVGVTWTNWRPVTTVFSITPTTLPDSLFGNVQFLQGVTLAQAFTVGGNFSMSGAGIELALNGWPLRVDGDLSVQGTVRMESAADSLDVGGNVSWATSSTAGMLTDGVMVLRGGFAAISGSPSFEPSGTHRTVFEGSAVHPVRMFPGSNAFNHVELRGTGGLSFSDLPMQVNGALTESQGAVLTVTGDDGLLAYGPVSLDGVVFDSGGLTIDTDSLVALHALTFRNLPTADNLSLSLPGGEIPLTFADLVFEDTVKNAGTYFVRAVDRSSNGYDLTIRMAASTPLDGSALTFVAAGNDGATVSWSHQEYQMPPLSAQAGSILSPVEVRVVGPDGLLLSGYSGAITIAIGSNPAGGTLGGTTTVAAVGGVATFADLSIDSAGVNYTLVATAPGLTPIVSDDFNVTVPLPAGFTTAWVGGVSTDWNDAANWSAGLVPDTTANVFISLPYTNTPTSTGSVRVGKLRVEAGATLEIQSSVLMADSSVEAYGAITGAGSLQPIGTGTLTGDLQVQTIVGGNYDVMGTLRVAPELAIGGDLHVSTGDSVIVTGLLGTVGGTGRLYQDASNAVVMVDGDATFDGGSTDGTLTDGVLLVSGTFSTGSSTVDAFAPSGGHNTVFNGGANQFAYFFSPDTTTGSHFAHLQVSTNGVVTMVNPTWVTGNLLVTAGATLTDSLGSGIGVLGVTTVDSGATLAPSRLAMAGSLNVLGLSTYAVPVTVYFGAGAPLPIQAAPYDTVLIARAAVAAEGMLFTGDLRIQDGWGAPARFDVADQAVVVGHDVAVNGDGALVMQNAAGQLTVAGNYSTNGADSRGLLTAGTLEIAGNFDQAADGSGESFRAGSSHLTRFTGGSESRYIEFDSPSFNAADSGGSHFGRLELPTGLTTVQSRVPASVSLDVGGSVTMNEGVGQGLASYGGVTLEATVDSIHVEHLEAWTGLSVLGGGSYDVEQTRLYGGGGELPALPYQSLLLVNDVFTMGGDLALSGDLSVGIYCSEVCSSSGGGLIVGGGNDLIIGGSLNVMGLGHLTMAAGDSVDVSGETQFRTSPEAGHFTGGTLVVRGRWNTVGSGAFQADPAHRTVMLATGVEDIYPTSNTWFGKLVLLDAGHRWVRSSEAVRVLDSLILGATTAGLVDTFGFSTGNIIAEGPVVTVSGSTILMGGSVRFDHDSNFVSGSYSAGTTIFGGTTQPIPVLPYNDIEVVGTAFLTDSLNNGPSWNTTIDGSGGPADLDLGSFTLRTGNFATGGQGTVTMTQPSAQLVVAQNATFNGGDETGKLSDGTLRLLGFFTQDTANSQASFHATGNHMTVFADSSFGGSQAVLASMTDGSSRFAGMTVAGNGVLFFGPVRIDGDVALVAPTMDSVGGGTAVLGGSLSDPSYKWLMDSTRFLAPHPAIPDSIDGTVEFLGAVDLSTLLRIGGGLTIQDSLVVNSNQLRVGGDFAATGNGLLVMTASESDVEIQGQALFDGATATGSMTGGDLKIHGNLTVGPTNGLAFDATGNHSTAFITVTGSSVEFLAPGAGFQNLTYSQAGLQLISDVLIRGDLSGSGETPGPIAGNNHLLTVNGLVEQLVTFDNTKVRIPSSNTLFDVDFVNMDPTATQLTVVGPGNPEALQLGAIRFGTLPTTGHLVEALDTLANGDSLVVQMMSSRPFSPVAYGLNTGEGRVEWGSLVVSALPSLVDSAVPFTLGVDFINPNGSSAGVSGSATIALASNPDNVTLGGTLTVGIIGGQASFNDLHIDTITAGLSFFVSVDGQPTDTITTGLLNVINPAPLGSIAWDGEGGDNLWNNAANWAGDVIPGPSDSAFIGGGMAVLVSDSAPPAVGGLVLGSGATLSIDPSASLTVAGRLTAGNTIYGSGSLILAGSVMPVSGAINAPTTITGTIVTTGTVTFGGNVTVDGPGAELNVGGASIQVFGDFTTQNGGVLTMDAPTDTLRVGRAFFNGGSTQGLLTAGALIVQGNAFSQGGPTESSFSASGTHTTVFEDAGDNSNVTFTATADSSHFGSLRIASANGVGFTAPFGIVRLYGDLQLAENALTTADTFNIDGGVLMDAGSQVNAAQVYIGGTTSQLQGTWNVEQVTFFGSGQSLPAFDGYRALVNWGESNTFGGPATARSILVTSGTLGMNGHRVQTDSLLLFGSGKLAMLYPQDTVVVDSLAHFQGGNPSGLLNQGLLELRGNFTVGDGAPYFNTAPGHVTRLAGAPVHLLDLPGEFTISFGTLIVDSGVAHVDNDLSVTADLVLHNGAIADSVDYENKITVLGNVLADNGPGTSLHIAELDLYGSQLSFAGDTANFDPGVIRLWGTGATVQAGLPYRTLMVLGDSATLGGTTEVEYLVIDGSGGLRMGGNILAVDSMMVSSNAHLRMQNVADRLEATGWVMFQGDSSEGDYTAGSIRAAKFVQATGPSGDPRSFAQTGAHRLTPIGGDTIIFTSASPLGSRLRTLTFDSAGSTLYVEGGIWIEDSLAITGAGSQLVETEGGSNIAVGYPSGSTGTVIVAASSGVTLDILGTSGTFDVQGSYAVGLTRFFGDAQPIPAAPAYENIEVQYGAYLTGSMTLPEGATFQVGNFGDLALAGNILTVDTFRTSGYGVLRMQNALDTLRTMAAIFGGGSTAGTLTHGGIETGVLYQTSSVDSASFAPSGLHTTTFENLGGFSETGRDFGFESPGAGASHFANVRFLATDGVNATSNVYVAGTTYINNTFDGPGRTLTGAGPVDIGPGATVQLDTLRILDSLSVDPAAGMTIGITVFGPAADPMPASYPFGSVGIEGTQTLTELSQVAGDLYLMEEGALHINGQKLLVTGDVYVTDSARLVMASPFDTVETQWARFRGGATGFDLVAGTILIRAGFEQMSVNSPRSFSPTGTKILARNGGTVFASFESADTSASFFRHLEVDSSTTLLMMSSAQTTGILNVMDNSTFEVLNTLGGADAVRHRGQVLVDATSSFLNNSFATTTFDQAPTIGGTFYIQYAALEGVSTIPALPWNNLAVRNGGNITLGSDLAVTGFMELFSGTVGGQDLDFNSYNINASGLSTNGYATITMTDPGDTLETSSGVGFYGGDETGKMTAGLIRTGNGLMQEGNNSPASFYSTGTVVEFTNSAFQSSVQFGTPETSQFAGIRAPGASTLWLKFNTDVRNTGDIKANTYNLEANPGVLFTTDSLFLGGGTIDIDRVRANAIAPGAQMPVWSVGFTEYAGNGTIADLAYDTLVVTGIDSIIGADIDANHVSVNGTLAVTASTFLTSTGDVVVGGAAGYLAILGGGVLVGDDFITTGGGRFEMDSAEVGLDVAGDALIGGGSTTGLLKSGLMTVNGDFTQSGSTSSFDAGANNTDFTTRFQNGGVHNVTFAAPGTSRFGSLSIDGSAGDTLQLGSSVTTNGLTTIAAGATILSADVQLYAIMDVDVNGVIFDGTRVLYDGPSALVSGFNDVTFTNMNATLPQLVMNFNGGSLISLANIDFDDAGSFFLEASSIFSSTYTLAITGPDFLIGAARSTSPDGQVTINFQAP